MDVTESGMVTDVSEVHPQNAEDPMDVTESGMVTDVSEVHPENALFPMDVRPSGRETDFMSFPPHLVSEKEKSVIEPEPVTVRAPVDESYDQARSAPQEPLVSLAASEESESFIKTIHPTARTATNAKTVSTLPEV